MSKKTITYIEPLSSFVYSSKDKKFDSRPILLHFRKLVSRKKKRENHASAMNEAINKLSKTRFEVDCNHQLWCQLLLVLAICGLLGCGPIRGVVVIRPNLIGYYLAGLKLEKYGKLVALVSLDKSVTSVCLFFYSSWGEGGGQCGKKFYE